LVYYRDEEGPRFLLIKRRALSCKIERVAPKGKVQKGEKIEDAVLREVSEEAGIPINQMSIKQKIGKTELRNTEMVKGYMNKDVTYFMIEYKGDPTAVHIQDGEGYLGVYKWATIQDVLKLIYYSNLRELIRTAYQLLQEQ
jgi:8-oxo-dGTP pyrophosphatase MutT (NUDIX family)